MINAPELGKASLPRPSLQPLEQGSADFWKRLGAAWRTAPTLIVRVDWNLCLHFPDSSLDVAVNTNLYIIKRCSLSATGRASGEGRSHLKERVCISDSTCHATLVVP